MNGLVAIVISNYNGASSKYNGKSILEILFDSMKRTSYKNYKLIFADDSSRDDSIDFIKRNFPKAAIVKNKGKRGFSSNNNSGIKYAMRNCSPDYVLLLNSDIKIIDRNWLSGLVSSMNSNKTIGIEGCKLVYPSGKIQHAGLNADALLPYNIGRGEEDNGQYDRIAKATGVTFACALMRREMIEKIGLLDENFNMGYEDTDYCMRARKSGFSVLYNGKVCLEHLEGYTTSSSSNPKSREKRFYDNQRNGAYFASKYYNPVKRMCALGMLITGSFVSVEGQDRVRGASSIKLYDQPFRRLGLTIRALREGRRIRQVNTADRY